jgi:hypothetical protein
MLSAPLYLSTDLGNGCWSTRALLQGNEGVHRLAGSECVLKCGMAHWTLAYGVTVEVPWRSNRKKRSKQLRITIRGKTRCVLLHFDSSKCCVCPLYKFLYAFKVVKLFLKHPVYIYDISCLMVKVSHKGRVPFRTYIFPLFRYAKRGLSNVQSLK